MHTGVVKSITLSADEAIIERAHEVARSRSTTLNSLFREWLDQLTRERSLPLGYDQLMDELTGVRSGRKFSRQELNEG